MASVDAERAVALFHQHDIPVFGILRNMAEFVCPCCGERQPLFDPGATRDVARQMHVADLGALPADPAAARRAEDGVPIVVGEPDGVAAAAFAELSGAVKRAIAREHAGMQRRDNDSEHTIWELIHDE
jgi:ATP-binding protein involved in chromosome partitioning